MLAVIASVPKDVGIDFTGVRLDRVAANSPEFRQLLPRTVRLAAWLPEATPSPPTDQTLAEKDFRGQSDKQRPITVHIDGTNIDYLARIIDLIEYSVEKDDNLNGLLIPITWVSTELLENAFAHNIRCKDDAVDLTISHGRHGILISVSQPDDPAFDLSKVLRDPSKADSFMPTMARRGYRWFARRAGGRLEIGVELPRGLSAKREDIVDSAEASRHPIALPSSVSAFMTGTLPNCREGKIVMSLSGMGRVDMSNADAFRDWLMASMDLAPNDGGVLILDLRNLEYISSAGLRSLIISYRESKKRNIEFALSGLQDLLMEIFNISRFDLVFKIFKTTDEAFLSYRSNQR